MCGCVWCCFCVCCRPSSEKSLCTASRAEIIWRNPFWLIAFFTFAVRKNSNIYIYIKVKVKWSRYRPGVAQRVGRGIALLFHDRGTRRGWVVSSTPRPHLTSGKDPVPILQEAGWAPGPVWTGGKSRFHRDSIRDRPARSQSLYRLSYPAHIYIYIHTYIPDTFRLFGHLQG